MRHPGSLRPNASSACGPGESGLPRILYGSSHRFAPPFRALYQPASRQPAAGSSDCRASRTPGIPASPTGPVTSSASRAPSALTQSYIVLQNDIEFAPCRGSTGGGRRRWVDLRGHHPLAVGPRGGGAHRATSASVALGVERAGTGPPSPRVPGSRPFRRSFVNRTLRGRVLGGVPIGGWHRVWSIGPAVGRGEGLSGAVLPRGAWHQGVRGN